MVAEVNVFQLRKIEVKVYRLSIVIGVLVMDLGLLSVGWPWMFPSDRDAMQIVDSQTIAESAAKSSPTPTTGSNQVIADKKIEGQGKPDLAASQLAGQPNQSSGTASRIDRIVVAAVVLPLFTGLILLACGIIGQWRKKNSPLMVAVLAAGVSGMLMLVLGGERISILGNGYHQIASRSAWQLLLSATLCLIFCAIAAKSAFGSESGKEALADRENGHSR